MGRGNERTILKTTMEDIWVRIVEAYIEKEAKKGVLIKGKMTRTKVMQDALLILLAHKGMLEESLKAAGVPDNEVQKTIMHLKVEYDLVPKVSQSKQ